MFQSVPQNDTVEGFVRKPARSQSTDVEFNRGVQRRRALEVAAADAETAVAGEFKEFSSAAAYFKKPACGQATLNVLEHAAEHG